MSDGAEARGMLLVLLRTHRRAVIGYALVLALAVVGAKLGDAINLWFYALAAPLGLAAAREVPRSIAERKARQRERERVRAVAGERGYERHLRRDR